MTPLLALAASDVAPSGFSDRPLVMLALLAGLSLLPFALVLTTSFAKIAVVLALLRNALGAPQVPPTMVVTGLAMLLSIFVMAPVGERMAAELGPVLAPAGQGAKASSTESAEALVGAALRGREPLREFLLRHAAPRDRAMFTDLARRMREPAARAQVTDRDFLVVAPAFVTTELKEAFVIGFLLFLPFLVLDLLVSNVLLSLGMHMLSPTTVSLPFKLLLFVLVDGWALLGRGLVLGYG